jgi:hypothetical protein
LRICVFLFWLCLRRRSQSVCKKPTFRLGKKHDRQKIELKSQFQRLHRWKRLIGNPKGARFCFCAFCRLAGFLRFQPGGFLQIGDDEGIKKGNTAIN